MFYSNQGDKLNTNRKVKMVIYFIMFIIACNQSQITVRGTGI